MVRGDARGDISYSRSYLALKFWSSREPEMQGSNALSGIFKSSFELPLLALKTPSETHSVKIHYWKSIICFSLASLVGTDRCVSDIASATSSNKNRTSWHFPGISRTKKKTWPHTTNVESIKDNFSPSHWTRWNAKGATTIGYNFYIKVLNNSMSK